MGRREQREQIFKLLFRVEFNKKEEMPEQLQLFFEEAEKPVSEEDRLYISDKYEKIMDKLSQIDELLNEKAQKWSTDRMGKVELTILRLAVYEIRYDEDIPTSVAINEAVELAKKFGQKESGSFVNGILARFAE
ncbi:MAG: transcription antitermination factor NusB [Lachnospiraceae bacterium]|nr:transcription antitermination factor NusB [Lachnospiraceae bacterium]